jgi:hypothetical protein
VTWGPLSIALVCSAQSPEIELSADTGLAHTAHRNQKAEPDRVIFSRFGVAFERGGLQLQLEIEDEGPTSRHWVGPCHSALDYAGASEFNFSSRWIKREAVLLS